jgi:GT2 family glycosyltransferase
MSQLNTHPRILTVSVTYGERWGHLVQVIPAVFQQEFVEALVLVDNAVPYDLSAQIRAAFPQYFERIQILRQSENLGSAGGFALGLQEAYALGADFVYLIDDDNLPETRAVQVLYEAWQQVKGQNELLALLSFRYQNLPNLQKAAYGQEVRYFQDKPNSFLGFSVLDALRKRTQVRTAGKAELLPQVSVQQAPYGGLFLPRATIMQIGFPRADLYLYADDTEYTYRIIQQGGKIWMFTASRLKDLEHSWWSDAKTLKARWKAPILEEGGLKAYYSTRNLTWFLWQNLSPQPWLFLLNGLLYLAYLLLIALVSGRLRAYGTVLRAVGDGLRGKLGK